VKALVKPHSNGEALEERGAVGVFLGMLIVVVSNSQDHLLSPAVRDLEPDLYLRRVHTWATVRRAQRAEGRIDLGPQTGMVLHKTRW
jgi:hypothetical protein